MALRPRAAPGERAPVFLNVGAYAVARGMASTPNVREAYVALDIALDVLAAEDRLRPLRATRPAGLEEERAASTLELFLDEADRSHVLTSFRLGGHTIDELFGRAYEHGMVICSPGAGRAAATRSSASLNMGALMSDDTIDELFAVLTR